MHKKTRKGKIMQELARNNSLEAKREIFGGVGRKCGGQGLL